MFGYLAHHELSTIGKAFTKEFFGMNSTKLYSYYQACSEGGREGFSQVQRFGEEWDGAIIGAPALRFSFQVRSVTATVGGTSYLLLMCRSKLNTSSRRTQAAYWCRSRLTLSLGIWLSRPWVRQFVDSTKPLLTPL